MSFLQQGIADSNQISTALANAVFANSSFSYSIIGNLLDQGGNPNVIIPEAGETILQHAVRRNMGYMIIGRILDAGANPNMVARQGQPTALTLALESPHHPSSHLICRICDAGADPNLARPNGEDALIFLLRTDPSTFLLSRLLDAGHHANGVNNSGETVLICALRAKSSEYIIQKIVQAGADPNVSNVEGTPALVLAMQSAKVASWIALVDRGAHVNARDGNGWTALMYASRIPLSQGHPLFRQTLESSLQSSRSSLEESRQQFQSFLGLVRDSVAPELLRQTEEMIRRRSEEMRRRIEANIRVQEIQLAVSSGQKSHLTALLEVCATTIDVDAQAQDGRTALMIASQAGMIEHVTALLNTGRARCLLRNYQGQTAFHLAAWAGQTTVVLALLAHCPVTLYDIDWFGRHALHCSLLSGHAATALAILNADLEDKALLWLARQKDNEGNTALVLAARLGHVDLVKQLVPLVTEDQICHAQVSTRLGVGSELARLQIHHHLLITLVKQYHWFRQPGSAAPRRG